MNTFKLIQPISKQFFMHLSILKSMMYCGVLWGLYDQGWAIKSDQNERLFPFWFNSIQALHYAQDHWPHYQPRRITPHDFEISLLPTLMRFNVVPSLFISSTCKFNLSTLQMRHFFFNHSAYQPA